MASQARTIFQYKTIRIKPFNLYHLIVWILIVVYDVNIYNNYIDTHRDGFDKKKYM